MLKKIVLMAAALVAAVLVFISSTLPPRALVLAPVEDGTIAGLIHVHTNRSDGLSGPDVVAAAAARAGLKFLIFTDHGDATRPPDPPQYRSGVLCLDGVEVSTSGGHYIAFDMPASPYPLAGEARDVVEDVRRLGGFGIVAHPDSPKAQLRWIDWTAPFDGVELLNLDTSWRVIAAQPGFAPKRRLAAALLDYPFRAVETISSLIQPPHVVREWEAAAHQRRVISIAGVDAHARLGLRGGDPEDPGFALSIPGYESSFRTMSIHVRPDQALTGDAASDATLLVRAIRNGHLYTAVDGLASPPSFDFMVSNTLGTVHGGDVLGAADGITLRVRSNAPSDFTTVVYEGTTTLSAVVGTQDLTVHGSNRPGVYWAEIVSNRGTPPTTWIRSNPAYVRGSAAAEAVPRSQALQVRPVFDSRDLAGWRVEHDPNSAAAFEVAENTSGPELRYRFGLAGGSPIGQFTALVYDVPTGISAYDQVALTIRAERPMRLSVQIRDAAADRWQRSVYLDTSAQERMIPLADFMPVGVTHVMRPDPAMIRALMMVVDTTNTKPGSSGRIWIQKLALQGPK